MRCPKTLTLLAVIAAPALAHAQGGPMQGACKTDIQSLCWSGPGIVVARASPAPVSPAPA